MIVAAANGPHLVTGPPARLDDVVKGSWTVETESGHGRGDRGVGPCIGDGRIPWGRCVCVCVCTREAMTQFANAYPGRNKHLASQVFGGDVNASVNPSTNSAKNDG